MNWKICPHKLMETVNCSGPDHAPFELDICPLVAYNSYSNIVTWIVTRMLTCSAKNP